MITLKKIIPFIFLCFITPVKAQTISDFIRMIDTKFEPYQDGEMSANDSLTDIKNGYYQRGFYDEDLQNKDNQIILRQVTVFTNEDGTKTIAESVSYYNFVCMSNAVKFYLFDNTNLLYMLDTEHFLPLINEEELLTEKALLIFKKYFTQSAHKKHPTLRAFISSAYDNIRYELPRYGTSIIAHIDYCDYFGEGLEISDEDLKIIINDTQPIKLSYDKKLKQFVK